MEDLVLIRLPIDKWLSKPNVLMFRVATLQVGL